MNVAMFIHKSSGQSGRVLRNCISDYLGGEPPVLLENTNALKYHLKDQGEHSGKEILLLLAETRERLEELICLHDLLEDRRLVLVVPDEDPATLSRAQQLFPRFFTPVSDRYDDLCSVISRMITRTGSACLQS